MCGQCNDGYKSLEMMECEKCPSWSRTQLNTASRIINVLVVIYMLSNNNIKNVEKDKPTLQTMLRVIISHVGFLTIITNIKYRYPLEIKSALSWQSYILSFFTQLISF
jgi:hypothetical protein